VAELKASDQPDPAVQSSLVSYRGDTGDLYQGYSDGPAHTPDSLTPLVVLGARRSVAVARRAQAEQYAQAELGMAATRLDSLEWVWNRNPKDAKAYAELARETMRRADIARRLGTDRAAEAAREAGYNQQLSQARAESVRDYLVEQGIPAARIPSVEGFGRTRPAAPNDTPANREKNRRVEIVIE